MREPRAAVNNRLQDFILPYRSVVFQSCDWVDFGAAAGWSQRGGDRYRGE